MSFFSVLLSRGVMRQILSLAAVARVEMLSDKSLHTLSHIHHRDILYGSLSSTTNCELYNDSIIITWQFLRFCLHINWILAGECQVAVMLH